MKCLISSIFFAFLIVNQVIGGEYHNVNGTNYWISYPLMANYHQAFRNCAINGMYLVSIHSQNNFDAVMEAISKYTTSYPDGVHFWTSGTSLGHPEAEFYWAQTGYPVTFSNWIAGYPLAKPQGKCMIMTGGKTHQYRWSEQVCETKYYFVCEDKINLPQIKGTDCHFNHVG